MLFRPGGHGGSWIPAVLGAHRNAPFHAPNGPVHAPRKTHSLIEPLDMCLAAPSKVIEVRDGMAVTECFGQIREVSLMLMTEDVAVGDYVLIQAGGFAFERIDAERAAESLALMEELLDLGGGCATRPLGVAS